MPGLRAPRLRNGIDAQQQDASEIAQKVAQGLGQSFARGMQRPAMPVAQLGGPMARAGMPVVPPTVGGPAMQPRPVLPVGVAPQRQFNEGGKVKGGKPRGVGVATKGFGKALKRGG